MGINQIKQTIDIEHLGLFGATSINDSSAMHR